MAFKKEGSTAGTGTKKYFWRSLDFGNGMSQWTYVTTDAPTTVEVSGYFDDDELEAVVRPGDELRVFQVAALDDTREVQEDIAAGFVDFSRHFVVASDGSGINITPDIDSATITYTS